MNNGTDGGGVKSSMFPGSAGDVAETARRGATTPTPTDDYDDDEQEIDDPTINRTHRVLELVLSVCCILAWRLPLAFDTFQLTIRPIPYQQLDENGEYILHLGINEIFERDTVSSEVYLFIAGLIPLVLQCCLAYFWGMRGDVHGTICVYCVGLGLTGFVTEWIKYYVGYLRPSFYQLCEPNDDYSDCTNSDEEDNARKSFPSGHSSISFCGLTLLTLYLHHRFGVPSIQVIKSISVPATAQQRQCTLVRRSYRAPPFKYRIISLLSLLPMGVATFVAVSRVHDNKHFPADVVGGSLLGGAIAIFIHGLWIQ